MTILTLAEAAAILRSRESDVLRELRAGRLQGRKLGRKWRVS